MRTKHFILFLGLLYIAKTANTQTSGYDLLNAVSGKLVNSVDNSTSIFLHIDKTIQSAGGTIWCKAYLFQQSTNIPITTPTTVYIDLVNYKDSTIKHLLLESSDLRLEAAISIPATVPQGYYTIRAYTSEMVKNNPKGIFYCPIYITNSKTVAKEEANCFFVPAEKKPARIQFIPEGNWLINGIDNKVVVLSFNKEGEPVPVSGIIKDSRDSVVASFKIGASGAGSFSFQPVKSRKYKAIISKDGAVWKEENLPDVPINAYQLAITKEDASTINARIGLSDLLYTKTPSSYLVGMSKGKICFTAMGKGMYAVSIPKANFPAGVADFYLFDENQVVVSRRKLYIAKETATVTMETDKKEYFGRSTVKMSVSITDNEGKPLQSLLSVAVVDQKLLPSSTAPSFQNYTSKNNNALFLQNRFPYKELTASEKDAFLVTDNLPLEIPPAIAPNTNTAAEIPGIIIKGHLLKANREPVANQPISLMSEEQRNILLFDTTDNSGYFEFSKARFYDSTKFFIYADVKNQQVPDWIISLDKEDITFKDAVPLENYCVTDPIIQQNIQNHIRIMADSIASGNSKIWLQEIIVKASSKKGQHDNPKNRFTNIITREQLSKLNLSSTVNAVKMIPGVVMIGNQLTIRGGMQGIDNSAGTDLEPLVVVDGVPARISSGVSDYLNSLNPDNIDYIEVLKGPEAAIYGTRSGNGVIIVKTGLPGNHSNKQKNMKAFYPAGFHYAPDFFQPPYDVDAVRDASFNDNRSTIYWNGHLQTDDKGKVQLQFYTGDTRTTYLITLTGITAKGDIITKQMTISRN